MTSPLKTPSEACSSDSTALPVSSPQAYGLNRLRSATTTTAAAILPLSLNDMFTFLPSGHEKAIKQAFYNTATILFVLLVTVGLIACYFVLEPFLRPLLWALLIGSALHPFKQRLVRVASKWLAETKSNNQAVTINSVALPLKLVTWIMDSINNVIKQYFKLLMVIFLILVTTHLLIYYFTFTHKLINLLQLVISHVTNVFQYLQLPGNTVLIMAAATGHLLAVAFFWNNSVKSLLVVISPVIWISVICQLVAVLGTFGLFLIVAVCLLAFIGVVSSLFGVRTVSRSDSTDKDKDQVDHSIEEVTSLILSAIKWVWYLIKLVLPSHQYYYSSTEVSPVLEEMDSFLEDGSLDGSGLVEAIRTNLKSPPAEKKFTNMATSPFHDVVDTSLSASPNVQITSKRIIISNAYIYSLLWTCLLAQIWSKPHILILLPFPLAFVSLKWLWQRFYLPENVRTLWELVGTWFDSRKDALIHPTLRTLVQYLIIGDKTVAYGLEKSVDYLASLTVMCGLVCCLLLAGLFLSFEIYGESIHLVNLVSNVVNSTIVNNPELSGLFGGQDIYGSNSTLIDEMVGNAYLYGRKWLKKTVRHVLNVGSDESAVNASMAIERQLLEVLDRSYQMWLVRDSNSSSMELNRSLIRPKYINNEDYNYDKLLAALKTLDFALVIHVIKENIDTVLSVLESVWMVLKGNLTLLFSALTALFSLLLSGSSALLNGCLNFIVFSTSLFYLLASSGEQYKAVELVSKLFPSFSGQSSAVGSNNKFGKAFNEAINSVFAASLKMTAFYGLYTWLIHTLFEARLVYIPSVMAAIFGAVPFLGAYWASLPAVIELWLVSGQNSKAILLFVLSILPSYFVDSAIYSEIKGAGHPYLTGLAIAGGVFYCGVEGALFGPILLCCLFVAVNMYTSVMFESTGQSSPGRIVTDSDIIARTTNRPKLKRLNTTIQ